MDNETKKEILDFLFPLSPTGRELYDDETQYKRIAERHLASLKILQHITREDVLIAEKHSIQKFLSHRSSLSEILAENVIILNFLKYPLTLRNSFWTLQIPILSKPSRQYLSFLTKIHSQKMDASKKQLITILENNCKVLTSLIKAHEIWNTQTLYGEFSLLENYYYLKKNLVFADEIVALSNRGASVMTYILSKGLL